MQGREKDKEFFIASVWSLMIISDKLSFTEQHESRVFSGVFTRTRIRT